MNKNMQRYRVDETSAGFRVYDTWKYDYVKVGKKMFLAEPKEGKLTRYAANDEASKLAKDLESKRRFCGKCDREVDKGELCKYNCK